MTDPRWNPETPVSGEGGGLAGPLGPLTRPAAGDVLPFRRRAVKPRRRRRPLALALLRPAATALLLVGVPAAAGAWMLTSPRFALSRVEVSGTARVDPRWVHGRLAPLVGRNLVRLRLSRVETALEGHPWIAGVAVEKRLPDALAVQVVERRPAALVARADRLWLVDREGRPIAPAPAGARQRFLVVEPSPWSTGGDVPAALALAAEVAREEPVWASGLARVDVLGEGDFRLHTAALPCPVLVRAGSLAAPARRLDRALPALGERLGTLGTLDLRFTGRLLVRPAAAGGPRPARDGRV